MPPKDNWLSLKISEQRSSSGKPSKNALSIAVPKKIVRLATQRNRIKRVLREIVRKDPFFDCQSKHYHFRVEKNPGTVSERLVREKLKAFLR